MGREEDIAVLSDRLLELGAGEDWVRDLRDRSARSLIDETLRMSPSRLDHGGLWALRLGWREAVRQGDQTLEEMLTRLWPKDVVLRASVARRTDEYIGILPTSRAVLAQRFLDVKPDTSEAIRQAHTGELFEYPSTRIGLGTSDMLRVILQSEGEAGLRAVAERDWTQAKRWLVSELRMFGLWEGENST